MLLAMPTFGAPRIASTGVALAALSLLLLGCSSASPSGDAALGAQLYAENCQACHGDAATGAGRTSALTPSHGADGHTWHHADGQIADIVLGRLTYPGQEMPSFEGKLTDDQVASILAHIKLGWTEEMRQTQARVSEAWDEAYR